MLHSQWGMSEATRNESESQQSEVPASLSAEAIEQVTSEPNSDDEVVVLGASERLDPLDPDDVIEEVVIKPKPRPAGAPPPRPKRRAITADAEPKRTAPPPATRKHSDPVIVLPPKEPEEAAVVHDEAPPPTPPPRPVERTLSESINVGERKPPRPSARFQAVGPSGEVLVTSGLIDLKQLADAYGAGTGEEISPDWSIAIPAPNSDLMPRSEAPEASDDRLRFFVYGFLLSTIVIAISVVSTAMVVRSYYKGKAPAAAQPAATPAAAPATTVRPRANPPAATPTSEPANPTVAAEKRTDSSERKRTDKTSEARERRRRPKRDNKRAAAKRTSDKPKAARPTAAKRPKPKAAEPKAAEPKAPTKKAEPKSAPGCDEYSCIMNPDRACCKKK